MYDHTKKIPVWVAECITKDMVTSQVAKRQISDFQPDPQLPEEFCSSNADYRKSGWSRGHMAPAGNYKHCQNSMNDTFYLTNIVPQNMDNNSGYVFHRYLCVFSSLLYMYILDVDFQVLE